MTPTVPRRSPGSSPASLTRSTRGQPAAAAVRSSARVLDELAEPMTTTASHWPAMALRADWRLVVAKHRSRGAGHPQVGPAVPGGRQQGLPLVDRQGGLGQERDRPVRLGQALQLGDALDAMHGVGRDRHRPDRFLMALVADVHDACSPCRPGP